MANHPIAHIEIPTTDPSATGTFYRDVFGWKIETNPTYNYTIFQAEGGLRGGFAGPTEPTYKPDRLLVYLATDDIDATLATIEAHGGKTVVSKTEIPNVAGGPFSPTRQAITSGSPSQPAAVNPGTFPVETVFSACFP